jgi:hypothetical protein
VITAVSHLILIAAVTGEMLIMAFSELILITPA